MFVVADIEADRNQDISRDNNEEPDEVLRQNEWLQFRIGRLGVQGVERSAAAPGWRCRKRVPGDQTICVKPVACSPNFAPTRGLHPKCEAAGGDLNSKTGCVSAEYILLGFMSTRIRTVYGLTLATCV